MRRVGMTFAALLAAAPVAWAQAPATPGVPPVTPGAPAQPPAPPPTAAPADPRLDAHLDAWQKQMTGLVNFRADFALTRKDAVFQKAREYTGSVLVMKPNFARLRLDSVENKADYEAFICNGKAVYAYNGIQKTITEFPMNANPAAGGATDNLMVDLVSGMKAADAKKRFHISLFKEDANYVYLDIKPILAKDLQEFQQVRFALYGPGVKAPFTPYLPAQVWLMQPNGDTELWKFSNLQTNIPGVDAKVFEPVMIKDWTVKKARPHHHRCPLVNRNSLVAQVCRLAPEP